MVSKRCKARAVKVVFAAAGIAGVALAIACLSRSDLSPVQPETAFVLRTGEPTLPLGDAPLVSEVRSADDARSGPVPPVLFGIGRPDADDAPDLSTPAQAVYRVLELLDRAKAGSLSQCFCEGAPDPNESLYPRYVGLPVELLDVIEEGDTATVLWTATVHTEFTLDGPRWLPGETVTLTTRLVRVEGFWKLVRLHDGND